VKINGEAYKNQQITPGSYIRLERSWSPDDMVEIEFPMEIRLVQSHPLVEENRNHVAVMRGPVVYCLEDADLPEGVKATEINFPTDLRIQAEYSSDTLGGVTILVTEACRVIDPTATDRLYSDYRALTTENVTIKMIPYYAWANRGVSEMAVWIPIK
jgi:DUF1680 family protein